MKAIAQRREAATPEGLVGKVLCHDVRDAAGKIAVEKGARLTAATSKVLMEAPWEEIHLLAVDPTDLHEEEAGKRLAAAVVGNGVEVKGYTGGQGTLSATRRGLLRVRRQALADTNALEGISVFTLFEAQPVEPGETIGKCKVTPLVIPAETLRAVEKIARDAHGLVTVSGFRSTTIGAVAQERLDATARGPIPGACSGSRPGTARRCSGCPRAACSPRRRPSTWRCRRSSPASASTTGRWPSSAMAASSRATWRIASRHTGRTRRGES